MRTDDTIAGRPMAEAPRDGTIIIAENMSTAGVPATGHAGFIRLKWDERSWVRPSAPGVHYGNESLLQWWPADTPFSKLRKTLRTNWNFRPGNSDGGEAFQAKWCDRCIHERPIREDYDHAVANGLGCKILLNTMAFDIGDTNYPTEWTYDRETGEPKCTAFVLDDGQSNQTARCDRTIEMFPETVS